MEQPKPLRIIFCVPGRTFSDKFLGCWTRLLGYCHRNNIEAILSNKYTSNVYYVRSMCLGADVRRGVNQKPWDGKVEYDYIFWIDSDQVFEPEDVMKLIAHKKDIVGGIYKMDRGTHYAIVENWDEERFLKNGSFDFMTEADMQKHRDSGKKLLDVAYCGFGFLCVKKGVFESIEYPWFRPMHFVMDNGVEEFASEDVSFSRRITQRGYDIFIDINCRVGHEKTFIY